MLYALPQHIDHAALRDLSLQSRQKLLPHRAVIIEIECFDETRLSVIYKRRHLRNIYRITTVVVLGSTSNPSPTGRHVADDQGFQSFLASICFHAASAASDSNVVGRSFILRYFLHFVQRLGFRRFVRQLRSRLSHVELAGDHVRSQAGTKFAKKHDFAFRAFAYRAIDAIGFPGDTYA